MIETVDDEGQVRRREVENVQLGDMPLKTRRRGTKKNRKAKEELADENTDAQEDKIEGAIAIFNEKVQGGTREILNFGKPPGEGWVKLKATVDSGSTEIVTNADEIANVKVTESVKSKHGVEY